MKRHASIVIAASLALAGCSREVQELKEVTAPTLCNVEDGDGRLLRSHEHRGAECAGGCVVSMHAHGAQSDNLSRSRVRAGAVKSTPISTAEREHQASGHWSAAIAAVPFGARQAGRNAERVETMRGLWRCNAHAAGELDSLPPGSAIEQMLADYQGCGIRRGRVSASAVEPALSGSSVRPCAVNREEHALVPAEFMKWVWAGGRKLRG